MKITRGQLKKLILEIVKQSLTERIQDPTKEEMFEYLQGIYGNEEGFEGDAEAAIYWFANFNHGGQGSNLYSVLSTSRFRPGRITKGPQKDSGEEMMYRDLEHQFGGGESSLKEAGQIKPNKLSNSERQKIGKEFAKVGLDGNGRFQKKEEGLQKVTDALSNLGFQLDMVSGDVIMSDKGSRNLTFRRKNEPGQDAYTEQPIIDNSRIAFTWELLDGRSFEILAYAS